MPLPDPAASRAVLIGVDTYETLDDLPAVAGNIERLAALLTADDIWGLPPEHLTVLSNPTSKDDVLDAVHTAATRADDALLLYFAGHGLLTADADLRLALPHTDTERLYRGVAYDDVRDLVVHTGRALARVVILDCCYSGSALTGYMGAAHGIGNRTMAEGTYVMTSSAETKPAMAPPGEKYTAFTGELLRVIEEGVPGGPDPLPMDLLFTEVRDRLAARTGIPVPQQRARNAGHSIALVRNRWEPRSADGGVPAAEEVPPLRPPVFGRLARLLHALLVVAAVAGLPFAVAANASLGGSDGPCGSLSAPEVTPECGGVSDGRPSLMPELDRVSAGIARANAAVPDDEPFVTIALLAPPATDDAGARERIVHQVQGAYAAQRRINDADVAPYVRLVLAQPGSLSSRVSDRLVGMAQSEEHNLRAVVGFDVNHALVGAVVKDVVRGGVPAVAGSFTPNSPEAWGLDNGVIAWIMPSADDQVTALAAMKKDVTTEGRGVLVHDRDERGWYVKDLRDAFAERLGDTLHGTAQRYSWDADAGVMARQFKSIAANLCALPGTVENVLFAGTPAHLRHFVRVLGYRTCRDREFTVISGSEASALHRDPGLDWGALRGTGITVEYTSGAHPDGVRGDGMAELKDLVERRLRPYLGAVDLTDGETITAYDSTLTAAQAVRQMADPGQVPSTSAVAAGFLTLRSEAATGRICFDARGFASDKAVTLLRLDPDRGAPRPVATAYPRAGGCG